MPVSLKRRTMLGAGLAFALLASIATLAIRNSMRLGESDDWIAHSHDVIQLIENARLTVSRTALADYRQRQDGIVPGPQVEQERFRLRGMIESLKSLTSDNAAQQRRLALLSLSTAAGQTDVFKSSSRNILRGEDSFSRKSRCGLVFSARLGLSFGEFPQFV